MTDGGPLERLRSLSLDHSNSSCESQWRSAPSLKCWVLVKAALSSRGTFTVGGLLWSERKLLCGGKSAVIPSVSPALQGRRVQHRGTPVSDTMGGVYIICQMYELRSGIKPGKDAQAIFLSQCNVSKFQGLRLEPSKQRLWGRVHPTQRSESQQCTF